MKVGVSYEQRIFINISIYSSSNYTIAYRCNTSTSIKIDANHSLNRHDNLWYSVLPKNSKALSN